MQKKRILIVLGISFLLFTLPNLLIFGRGTGEQSAKVEAFKLRLGHVAPTEEPYHIAAVKWGELVKNYTQGKIEITIFPNSQLGSSRDLIEALQMGVVDFTLTTAAVLANFLPKTQVIELPFIFKSREHVYAVVDSSLADRIYAGAEDKKLKVLHTWENGFRNITNSVRPIKTPDDLKGIKIRVMENQMYIDMFKALGALPVPLARGELFTALQQKVVDAQENPMGQIYSSRFYEVQKYVSLTKHTYSPEVLLCSLVTWKKIPLELQKAVLKASEEARDYNRKLSAEKELEFIKKVQEKGMEVTDLTPEQIIPFQKKMVPVWGKYYSTIGKDLIEAVASFK